MKKTAVWELGICLGFFLFLFLKVDWNHITDLIQYVNLLVSPGDEAKHGLGFVPVVLMTSLTFSHLDVHIVSLVCLQLYDIGVHELNK